MSRFRLEELGITLATDEATLRRLDAIEADHAVMQERIRSNPMIFGTRRAARSEKE